MAPASSKLTQPVIFSSHQLCGFLCHLLEPASYPLWLCVFGDIWHLKESEAKVGMAEIHSKERHIGLPLQTRRINNGQAALTPGELWGVYGVSRKLLAASQLSFPTRRAVSHCLAFCRHVIVHICHITGQQMLPPIRIKLATPTCSQTSLARQLDQLESGLLGLKTHCVVKPGW